MYKLTRSDGYDFYSGTINYRKAIGNIIRVLDYDSPQHGVCGRGLHASRNPNDCFIGASIPCAAFRVQGIGRIIGDKMKSRYRAIKVIEEICDLDSLFGWRYSEVIDPIHPFNIVPSEITEEEIVQLKEWSHVRDSVRVSVSDSVRVSVSDSVRVSVSDSVRVSVSDSVSDYVWGSMWGSVLDSASAYIGSLFPNVKEWRYVHYKKGTYPFQPSVDLWKKGLVPSFDGYLWRLHGGEDSRVLWEGKLD